MKVRQRLWWVLGGIFLLFCVGFVLATYRFAWSSTGFLSKSLWDWLQLLIVPLVLAVTALVFQRANSRTEQQIAKDRYDQDREIAKQRYEQDQQIALDKQRQDLLQAYLDRMSELLLKEKLRSSEDDAEVRNVARVRTISVLTQLDARRIGYVFAFLREASLMSTSKENVVGLEGADLHAVNWSQANLNYADLSYADLSEANLYGAILSNAHLRHASLNHANLYHANLYEANLYGAHLSNADLSEANLHFANLIGASLIGADLIGAGLIGADLSETNLYGANLTRAHLSNVNLKDAIGVTVEELEKQAASLTGATMPDGSIHS